MDLEPVGPAAVATAALGHAHHEALPQATCLAGGSVLLVDHALVVVLALGDGRDVVEGASEEGLLRGKEIKRFGGLDDDS